MHNVNRLGFPINGFLCLSICLLVIAGCGNAKRNLLIGTWHSQEAGVSDITLNANGTCKMSHTVLGKAPGEPMISMYTSVDGTWKLDGDTVTLTADIDKTSPDQFKIIKIDETNLTLTFINSGQIEQRTKLK